MPEWIKTSLCVIKPAIFSTQVPIQSDLCATGQRDYCRNCGKGPREGGRPKEERAGERRGIRVNSCAGRASLGGFSVIVG